MYAWMLEKRANNSIRQTKMNQTENDVIHFDQANSNMLVHWCSFNIYIWNGIPLSETYLIIYLYMEQVLNSIQMVTSCLAKCDIPERRIHKDLRMSSTFGRI